MTSYGAFALDSIKDFQSQVFGKFTFVNANNQRGPDIMPAITSENDYAQWYNRTVTSWSLYYTIVMLDGAELLFAVNAVSSLRSRMSYILGPSYPISPQPRGLLPVKFYLGTFYRKDIVSAAANVTGAPWTWDGLLALLAKVNGELMHLHDGLSWSLLMHLYDGLKWSLLMHLHDGPCSCMSC